MTTGVYPYTLGDGSGRFYVKYRTARSSPGARERIKLPATHREMDDLRLEEIPRWLDACEDVYRPLAEPLIATGLRISEALALTWDDVDVSGRTLRAALAEDGRVRLDQGRRFRSVDLGARLDGASGALRPGDGPGTGRTIVFRGPRGGELSRSNVSRDLHEHALEDAALRRTCACTTCATPPPPRGWRPGCR